MSSLHTCSLNTPPFSAKVTPLGSDVKAELVAGGDGQVKGGGSFSIDAGSAIVDGRVPGSTATGAAWPSVPSVTIAVAPALEPALPVAPPWPAGTPPGPSSPAKASVSRFEPEEQFARRVITPPHTARREARGGDRKDMDGTSARNCFEAV